MWFFYALGFALITSLTILIAKQGMKEMDKYQNLWISGLFTIPFLLFILLLLPTSVFAQESNQFITIVNPVRISPNTENPKTSLEAQYSEILKRSLPATWLLTYDALINEEISSVTGQMNKDQEFGIFMEVSANLANSSGVDYKKDNSWHDSNVVFLSGYTQPERIKLIDKVFEKFKEKFGDYPKSVGAWWIDSFSLKHMKDKYNITSYLNVADQYSTDNYQVWGQYWSTPFYPSKYHAGVPANSQENKLDIVTIQWAPRDPLNGYGQGKASLYSTQDYPLIGQKDDYLEKLVDLYAKKHNNSFGQITLGLEGDLIPQIYKTTYARWLDVAQKFKESGEVEVVKMEDFSKWYRKSFTGLSPARIIETDDLLGKKMKVIWYQSPKYRIGIVHDYSSNETKVIDFRVYFNNFEEPYNISPNGQIKLSINIPSLVDEATSPQSSWKISKSKLLLTEGNYQKFKISLESGSIELDPESIKIPEAVKIPKIIKSSTAIQKNTITPNSQYLVSPPGITVSDLTLEATYFLQQNRIKLILGVGLLFLLIIILIIQKSKSPRVFKNGISVIVVITVSLVTYFWIVTNSQNYFVSQAEIDALSKLSNQPRGKIIVYDRDCLQCSWQTPFKPAAFANKRNYVKKNANMPIVYSSAIFNAKTREEGRNNLKKLNARYIYLVKYEDYLEKMPFSPGDYNLELIYENANAQIWQVN